MIRLEDQLGCLGYFGFGGGYARTKYGPADDTNQHYCSARCAQTSACWNQHRARVSMLYPEMVAVANDVAKTHRGAAYLREFAKRTDQRLDDVREPFTAVMLGNIQDGLQVGAGGRPVDRGPASLPWPFPRSPEAGDRG